MRETALPSIGFVGAGLSALSAAGVLRRAGFSVRLFEKSSGPGGRMATRRAGLYVFDHGGQYFTARDSRFVQLVEAWRAMGKVQRWEGRIGRLQKGRFQLQEQVQERFVGVPHMSSIGRHLAAELEVDYETRIEQIEGSELVSAELQGSLPLRYRRCFDPAAPGAQSAAARFVPIGDRCQGRVGALLGIDGRLRALARTTL